MNALHITKIRTEDLDQVSIYFYRIWARAMAKENPLALVIDQPNFITTGNSWVLYACLNPLTKEEIDTVAWKTRKSVIAVAPGIPQGSSGLDLTSLSCSVPDQQLIILKAFLKSAESLPALAARREPESGRCKTEADGTFEIWRGGQWHLICKAQSDQREFGYTWSPSRDQLYFFRSPCKKVGKCSSAGHFKLSEQKGEGDSANWSIDLLTNDLKAASLLSLVPAGDGYRVSLRAVPTDFAPMHEFSTS
jgi:hypothetical protein